MDVFGFLMFPKVYNLIDLCINKYNKETIRLVLNDLDSEDSKYSF